MAIITPDLIKSLMTSWSGDFSAGLGTAPSQYKEIATVIQSSSASNTYGWLGRFPAMREWIGDRVIKSMAAHGYSIENKKLESTVGVARTDLEDDTLGIYAPLFQEMGRSAGETYDISVFGALSKGFDLPCYDGQNFFDTEHPVYPETDGTGAPTSVSNVFMQSAEWEGLPWFVLDCSRAIKPIIYQERVKPQLDVVDSTQNDTVFIKDEYLYGTRVRGAAGFGFWQMAYACLGDLTADNLWTAIQSMRSFEGDGGGKLGIRATHLVVPPGLEKQATRLLNREMDAGANGTTSNELRGRLKLVIGDYL